MSVNLNKLFKGLTFTAAEEVTLSAGQALSKARTAQHNCPDPLENPLLALSPSAPDSLWLM